jgi:hypothetical protein
MSTEHISLLSTLFAFSWKSFPRCGFCSVFLSGRTIPRRDGFGFGCFSWMDYSQSVAVLFCFALLCFALLWTNFLYSVVAEDEWALRRNEMNQ